MTDITVSRELLRQILTTFEDMDKASPYAIAPRLQTALRAALEQPQNEPGGVCARCGGWVCDPVVEPAPVQEPCGYRYKHLNFMGEEVWSFELPRDGKVLETRPVYEAQQLRGVELGDIDQYRMQMAGISTAALGYWKEGDGIHPDYDTTALRDVANLYTKYDELYKEAQARKAVKLTNDEIKEAVRPLWPSPAHLDRVLSMYGDEYRAIEAAVLKANGVCE